MQDLRSSYRNTSYNIFNPEMKIKVGQTNSELDVLLEKEGSNEWAFITACNPFSRVLSEKENKERHGQLIEATSKYTIFEGEGVGTDPDWKPEYSLLILGISEKNAARLGDKFQQNAIVAGRLNEVARLVLLNIQNREH